MAVLASDRDLRSAGPYGTTLASKLVGRPDDIDMEPLPDTGTYTIVVDPGALTASLTLTLSEPVTGTITIDGPSAPVIIDKPGQDARLTFEGTAEQRVNLGVSEVSFETGTGLVEVSILRPDGTTVATRLLGRAGGDIDTEPLPDTGTYTIVVDPQEAKTVSLTMTLSEPLTGALTTGGPSCTVSTQQAWAGCTGDLRGHRGATGGSWRGRTELRDSGGRR